MNGYRKETYVLYVGRLSTAKNLPLLINAISKLKNHAKLLLVGSGPEESRLKTCAKKYGVADRVLFLGAQDQLLPGFYAISRVTVLPSIIESFGQVYLESLSCGTPAVGFAGDGKRVLTASAEIIRDEETGCTTRKINEIGLSEKIDWILNLEKNDYAKMKLRARADVLSRFSWHSFVQSALDLSFCSGT